MKISLYLMTQKGFEVLNELINCNYQSLIAEVIIGRDNQIDNDYANEIQAICIKNNILYYERRDSFTLSGIYAIAISWRWIISNNNTNLIVLHDSILPKYRGFAPLVNCLINKEKTIGVSAIFASDDYDTGDIIAQKSVNIEYPITIAEAIHTISKCYCSLVVTIFKQLHEGIAFTPTVQDESQATYSLWRDEHDYLINWEKDAEAIMTFVNAVSSPYKGASTYINGTEKIRITEVEIEKDVVIENRDFGKLIYYRNQFPVFICGKGLLKITKAHYDINGESIFPLKKFRIRLTNYDSSYS